MAQSLSTSQLGLGPPQDDMDLGSDVELGSDLVIDTDFQIDVDLDLTNDPLDYDGDDYILEDVKSEAEHRSEWQTGQVDDDLMQDEEQDGLPIANDATILDVDLEDVDLVQNLDNGVSLHEAPAKPIQGNTTTDNPTEAPLQSNTETVSSSIMNGSNMSHGVETTQSLMALENHIKRTEELIQDNQEHSIANDNSGSAMLYSQHSHEMSERIVQEKGVIPSTISTAEDNKQAVEFSEETQFDDPEYEEDPSYDENPDYDEDLDYDEDTSPTQDHGPHLHPITVLYQEMEMSLFPRRADKAARGKRTYFLKEESLADASTRELFQAMRLVLGGTVSEDDELELGVDLLDLYLTEGSSYTAQTTLSQVLDLYLALHQHDGVENPEPLYITLTVRASCGKRIKELTAAVEEGKGISQLSLWDDEHYNTADDQPIITDGGGATDTQRLQTGSVLEESPHEEAGHVGFAQDGITLGDNPAKTEEYGLAATSDNLADQKSESKLVVAPYSPHSPSVQGVSLDPNLPNTSTDDHLVNNADSGTFAKVAQAETRPKYDEDEITYEDDDEEESGPTGQSDQNGLSTQTDYDYDGNHDDCDELAVAKPSTEIKSNSRPALSTEPAGDNANDEIDRDLIEDHPTTARDVAPQETHEDFDADHQYEDPLTEDDQEDGLHAGEGELQASISSAGSSAGHSAESRLGPEADTTKSWLPEESHPTSHLLDSKINNGPSKEYDSQDEITYDDDDYDGSEYPQPVNHDDQDDLDFEIDYDLVDDDDQCPDHSTMPHTEEGEILLMNQDQATGISGAGLVGPKGGSEDSATEQGDVQADQWNAANATSNHNESEFYNGDRSSVSSAKRSRIDNDETEPQQNDGHGPKRVRSK
ncbi:MAG: hypothetical protein M1816_003940 [Peltula sp. TS41687]|nr:MAG: hypothetical protein M1816_003940 [Peltula sp. TS41687]